MALPPPRSSAATSLRTARPCRGPAAPRLASVAMAGAARWHRTTPAEAGRLPPDRTTLRLPLWLASRTYGMARSDMESTPSDAPKRKSARSTKTEAGKLYERPRGVEARQIADLMPAIGRTAFRRFGFVQSSVVTRWPEIVGERHARHCMPESIRFPPGE